MFRRKISVSDVFAVRKNAISQGLEHLHAMKLKDLQKWQRCIEETPDKYRQEIHRLREIGILLSSDWDKLRFDPDYQEDPDKLMNTIGAMLPPSVLEWKYICEKLTVLSDIFLLLHQRRDTESMENEIGTIRGDVLPDLEKKMDALRKELDSLQSNKELTDDEKDLIETKRILGEEIEEYRERMRMLQKEIDVYNIYGSAISHIYSSIVAMQANPKDLKFPIDWVATVSLQAILQSSTDPALKSTFKTTYETLLSVGDLDVKVVNKAEKANILFAALMADYKILRDQYGSTEKPSFEKFLNDHRDDHHPARKLGLILKIAFEHYPDAMPQNIKNDIKKFNLKELHNPYTFFLAHVSPPESKASRKSSGRR